jgi:arsenate reductase-like glutaredoxin family protein
MVPAIKLYALSTCGHCRQAKDYFEQHGIAYDCIHVDWLYGPERNDVLHLLSKYAMNPAFPTIVIGEKVVVGFRPEEIEAILQEYANRPA